MAKSGNGLQYLGSKNARRHTQSLGRLGIIRSEACNRSRIPKRQSIPIITVCVILLIVTSPACRLKAKSDPNPLITPSATVSGEGTLIFRSNRDGNDEIYCVQADGTGLTNLTNDPGDDGYYSWSPDGKQIAFYSDRNGHWELYVMNADGSNPRCLYGFGNPVRPAWSPDAKWIALSSDRIINVDGSGERPVAAGNGEPCRSPAVWSPDGTQFACETSYSSGTAIAVRYLDLGQTTYLTGRRFNEAPVWSPDGTRIAFRSWDTGFTRSGSIYTANPDGSGLTELSGYRDVKAPAWSPDGTKIAHVAQECTGLLDWIVPLLSVVEG
jgi:TolB protein